MRLVLALTLLASCLADSPSVDSVSPSLFCDEARGGIRLEIEGSNFDSLVVNALATDPELRSPQVVFTPVGGLAVGSAATQRDPVQVPLDRVTPGGRDRLDVSVDGGVGLESGRWRLSVVNPDQREGSWDGDVVVVGPPDGQALSPSGVCQLAPPIEVELRGAGFLAVDGERPVVEVQGRPVDVVSMVDCQPLAGGHDGQVCDALRFELDPAGLPLGSVSVAVRNPEPAACAGASVLLDVLRPATVTRIEPSDVCRQDDAFTLRGTDLLEGTRVVIAGFEADVEWVGRTEIRVQPGAETPPGKHDVEILTPQGCPVTVPDAITVQVPPLVFDVDPPVLPGGVSVEVVARVSDLRREVDEVWIEGADGTRYDVAWRVDASRGGEVRLTVPDDLHAGVYEVYVGQLESCASQPAASLTVGGGLDIQLESVEPHFVWSYASTAVVVHAQDPPPQGAVGFESSPRMWLVGPDGAPTLHRVFGVDASSAVRATAIVPHGLDPGGYDLLAVDDEGAMGWLGDAVTVVLDGPPEIDGVAPATLPNRRDARLRLQGRAFRDPSVRLTCREGGVDTTVSATVVSSSWSEIEVEVPADRFKRAVCLVAVENADGTTVQWAAVSITNPAQNLFPWRSGPDMVKARRAPAMGAGRTTSVSRWVYAVGGDEGTDDSPHASVEVASVGVYGDVGAWSLLPRSVPAARTRAGIVRLGRFLYLIGGHDGTRPTSSVLRAQILDPRDVPRFESMEITATDGGPAAGRYRYLISARFPASDRSNPRGESLPSEPIVVTLPGGVTPTFTWAPVDGALGYLIYRTAGPDQPRDRLRLLAEVRGQNTFTDDDSHTVSGVRPLPQGGLGTWHEVSPLTTARSSPCVVAVQDPFPDPERWWIYAAGGTNASGERLSTIERVDVELRSADLQVVGSWSDAGQALSVARSECGAYAVQSALHSVVGPEESWIYFVGGLDDRKATGTVDIGQFEVGGALARWGTIASTRPARAGFGVLSASNFLYALGGSQGRPSAGGASANLTGSFPDVNNWNSLGVSMSEGRYLPGSAQESAVIIVGGGTSNGAAASRSIDWTNW